MFPRYDSDSDSDYRGYGGRPRRASPDHFGHYDGEHTGTRDIDTRHHFLSLFSSDDDPPPFQEVYDRYTERRQYYATMMANVEAEAVAVFCSGAKSCKTLSGRYSVDHFVVRPTMRAGMDAAALNAAKAELQLKDNVVELDEELFWVTHCDVSGDALAPQAALRGFSKKGTNLHESSVHGERILKVHLFAGDYNNRYRCAMELTKGASREEALERAVLDPRTRPAGTYSILRPYKTDQMAINEEQRRAVSQLSERLEVVHGPPGTGKSTTIFHILSARLPDHSAAVVTCVTNQAIDSVAEKLAKTHELEGGLRMLVLGNPDRVGKTAGRYTLDELCKRDEILLSMLWAERLLQRTHDALCALQKDRAERLFRKHIRSRFSPTRIENLPISQRLLREHEARVRDDRRFGISVREGPPDLVAEYLKRLTETKRRVAQAVVRKNPFRLPVPRHRATRQVVGQHRPGVMPAFGSSAPPMHRLGTEKRWDVESFRVRVHAALKKATRASSLARETAEKRNVRRTRVLLCTIPSGYKVGHLMSVYEDDFPKRLFVAVLDEAAATAETYVPLLIRMGVENVVLLGDQKQLSPLVLATGGDRELRKMNVDRSLMERAMVSGARVHKLRVQYRMPEVLCRLVSGLFYDGELCTGMPNGDLHSSFGRLNVGSTSTGRVLRWLDVRDREFTVGTSKVNCGEVAQIVQLLTRDPVLASSRAHIMIITFYKPQATLLQQTLAGFLPKRLAPQGSITVVTVDAAQGSESPHVLLSTVRSNYHGNIGFVSNARRLNVAISRAQKTLTIVGSAATLKASNNNWRCVVDAFGPEVAQQADVHVVDYVTDAAEAMAERRGRGRGKGSDKGKGKGKGMGSRFRS